MGCFGYICKGCGTAIRGDCFKGGELCVMKHVRHGKVLGEVTGHYDEYGRVFEEKGKENRFRGNNDSDINSHAEICQSEFDMDDSLRSSNERIYKGELYDSISYFMERTAEILIEGNKKGSEGGKAADQKVHSRDFFEQCTKEFMELPTVPRPAKSGIVAWHKKCYDKATEEEKNDCIPSESDPGQSWGRIRKKYK